MTYERNGQWRWYVVPDKELRDTVFIGTCKKVNQGRNGEWSFLQCTATEKYQVVEKGLPCDIKVSGRDLVSENDTLQEGARYEFKLAVQRSGRGLVAVGVKRIFTSDDVATHFAFDTPEDAFAEPIAEKYAFEEPVAVEP